MGKTYIRLSASVQNADGIVNAIMFIKNMRVYESLPVEALFKKFPKNEEGETVGTYAEATRIIKYLEEDRTLIKDGKRFKWHGDANIWDDRDARRKYVLEMLEHADDTRIKVIRKNNEALPPALVAYNNKRKKQEAVINVQDAAIVPEQPVEQPAVEATIEQPVPKWMNVPAPEGPLEDVAGPDLTRLTDGQLNMLKWHISIEENRRRIEAKKAELLKVFSEMAKDEGFSLEDLM